jgi:acyl-CoA dehydrogenase
VLSAILKYHATERMRTALNDALDIHGGRAICDGPRNYLFGTYMSVPVAITVEGANILTRSLMIFGQGAIRCHPYLLKEMEAANLPDPNESLKAFDTALFAHIYSATSNVIRAFLHNLTFGVFARVPDVPHITPMYRGLHVASVTFAAVADLVTICLLKRRHPNLIVLADTSTREGMRRIFGGDTSYQYTLCAKSEWLGRNRDTARRQRFPSPPQSH